MRCDALGCDKEHCRSFKGNAFGKGALLFFTHTMSNVQSYAFPQQGLSLVAIRKHMFYTYTKGIGERRLNESQEMTSRAVLFV